MDKYDRFGSWNSGCILGVPVGVKKCSFWGPKGSTENQLTFGYFWYTNPMVNSCSWVHLHVHAWPGMAKLRLLPACFHTWSVSPAYGLVTTCRPPASLVNTQAPAAQGVGRLPLLARASGVHSALSTACVATVTLKRFSYMGTARAVPKTSSASFFQPRERARLAVTRPRRARKLRVQRLLIGQHGLGRVPEQELGWELPWAQCWPISLVHMPWASILPLDVRCHTQASIRPCLKRVRNRNGHVPGPRAGERARRAKRKRAGRPMQSRKLMNLNRKWPTYLNSSLQMRRSLENFWWLTMVICLKSSGCSPIEQRPRRSHPRKECRLDVPRGGRMAWNQPGVHHHTRYQENLIEFACTRAWWACRKHIESTWLIILGREYERIMEKRFQRRIETSSQVQQFVESVASWTFGHELWQLWVVWDHDMGDVWWHGLFEGE